MATDYGHGDQGGAATQKPVDYRYGKQPGFVKQQAAAGYRNNRPQAASVTGSSRPQAASVTGSSRPQAASVTGNGTSAAAAVDYGYGDQGPGSTVSSAAAATEVDYGYGEAEPASAAKKETPVRKTPRRTKSNEEMGDIVRAKQQQQAQRGGKRKIVLSMKSLDHRTDLTPEEKKALLIKMAKAQLQQQIQKDEEEKRIREQQEAEARGQGQARRRKSIGDGLKAIGDTILSSAKGVVKTANTGATAITKTANAGAHGVVSGARTLRRKSMGKRADPADCE